MDGLANLYGFHDIPQSILIKYSTVINQAKVLGQHLGQCTKT